jgi:hypothetical protein
MHQRAVATHTNRLEVIHYREKKKSDLRKVDRGSVRREGPEREPSYGKPLISQATPTTPSPLGNCFLYLERERLACGMRIRPHLSQHPLREISPVITEEAPRYEEPEH